MKQVNSGLFDALAGGYEFIVAEIYWITLADGTVLRYTSGDGDIHYTNYPVDGEGTLTAVSMLIEREDITTSTGVSVDDCKVSVYCDDSRPFNGLTLPNFALIGGFDNASVVI